MKNVLVVFSLLNFIQTCLAQNTNVLSGVYVTDIKHSVLFVGTVLDANSRQPIDSVSISIFSSEGEVIPLRSDSLGYFRCFLNGASYKMIYEKQHYIKVEEMIEFKYVPDTVKLTKQLQQEVIIVKSYKGEIPIDTIIKNKETAIRIAESILFSNYGEETIIKERPYNVNLINGTWRLSGTLPESKYDSKIGAYYIQQEGVFSIELSAINGVVLKLAHGK